MKCKSCKNRRKRNACFFLGILSLVTVVLCLSASCNADGRKAQKYEYGVFLNADRTAVPKLKNYEICITKISTFLILCDLAVCLATLYVSFSLVFALMRYLQGKVFLIRFYSPTTLSSSRAEFRLPSRLACA